MAVREGTVLDDRYRLGSVIGHGGVSEVYDGRDLCLDRPVAVKLLRAEYRDDPHLGRHFEQEARAAARLAHPHVVEIFDVGESGGHSYLVMERLMGGSLAHRLLTGPLDCERVRRLAGELLGALAAAHAGGILHQDIKPSNILFAANGSAKVADFGVARGIEHLSSGLPGEPTETNVIIGTPTYLAPERFEGLPATPRSDLWSLGVVLYEALLGIKPFVGESPHEVGYAVTHHRPVRLDWLRPELDPVLVATVHRALEKRPEQRFASATEMGAAIGTSVVGSSTPTSEHRAPSEDLDAAPITEPTARVGLGRDPRRIVSGLVAPLMASGKIRLRSGRRTPLLGAALVVLALSVLGGVLITGPLTSSTKRAAGSNLPTAPIKAPPPTAPTTAPPTPPTTAITAVGTSSASLVPPRPAPAIFVPPVTPQPVPPSPNAPGGTDHHHDNGGEKSHQGAHGD